MDVMKGKLSQKERKEVVDKGYLEDILESKDYITKDYLGSRNYVTKDWAQDMFQSFRTLINQDFSEQLRLQGIENRQYLQTIMEYSEEKFQVFTEKIDMRIERIERHVGLEPI